MVVSEIDYFIPGRFQGFDRTVDDIVNIGKITTLFSISIQDEFMTFVNPFDEPKTAHVRSSGRPIDRKKAQYCDI
jgi:hypothetical protein